MEFATAFKIADTAEKLTHRLIAANKSARGHKRKILLEILSNIDLLQLWRQENLPVDKIILKLETKRYEAAIEEDYNLNSIKGRALGKATARGVPQFEKYIGWSTEKLLDNVYRKIRVLKHIVELDRKNDRIKKSMRLNNIYKMLILIAHHVNS